MNMHHAMCFMLKVSLKVILFVKLLDAASSPFNFNAAFWGCLLKTLMSALWSIRKAWKDMTKEDYDIVLVKCKCIL